MKGQQHQQQQQHAFLFFLCYAFGTCGQTNRILFTFLSFASCELFPCQMISYISPALTNIPGEREREKSRDVNLDVVVLLFAQFEGMCINL